MSTTTNLNISLVQQNQAQKEITVNHAITVIDAILNRGAVSHGDNTPPVSPSNGDLYILGGSPTGDWATHADEIAYYQSGWSFIGANEGMTIWVSDEDKQYSFDGANWILTGVDSLDDLSDVAITSVAVNHVLQHNGTNFVNQANLEGLSGLGVNATSDSTNKLSVSSDAVLFNNNGTDSQVKVNKNTTTDTASHIFQNNFSGRAEFGLIADDDFQLKVSPDGSTYYQAYVVDKSSGNIDIKKITTFSGNVNCSDNRLIRAELTDYAKTMVSANSGATYTIDLENGNFYEVTLTANCTFTFSNPPASGKAGEFSLILKQDGTGSWTTTWPASLKWNGGTPPTLSTGAGQIDILRFITTDAGAAWYGFADGVNMS